MGTTKNNTELVTRICEMERRYDELSRATEEINDTLAAFKLLNSDLGILRDYMDSGQWQKDFEADEAGEIPSDVKRGVLSEDGLYNLLQRVEEIQSIIKGWPFAELSGDSGLWGGTMSAVEYEDELRRGRHSVKEMETW